MDGIWRVCTFRGDRVAEFATQSDADKYLEKMDEFERSRHYKEFIPDDSPFATSRPCRL